MSFLNFVTGCFESYKGVLEVIKKEKPDLIVVGGDIASFRHLEDKYETFFKELAKYGKVIMVCGYWDYYSQSV